MQRFAPAVAAAVSLAGSKVRAGRAGLGSPGGVGAGVVENIFGKKFEILTHGEKSKNRKKKKIVNFAYFSFKDFRCADF